MPSTTWYSRGYLPHFDVPGLQQSITFRLADSLPAEVAIRLQHECADDQVAIRRRIECYLDAGWGSCVLRRPACADAVQDALLRGDGDSYRLLAWAVMPNHVHVMIETIPGHPLGDVVKAWKGRSARSINVQQAKSGPLWQREYWDRFIRDESHYRYAREYIEGNPVKAGLVGKANEWTWSSAG